MEACGGHGLLLGVTLLLSLAPWLLMLHGCLLMLRSRPPMWTCASQLYGFAHGAGEV
jgi:hypothetical protein